VRYTNLYNVAGSPNYYNNLADTGYGPMTVHAQNIALGYTQTFRSTTVMDLRLGVNRFATSWTNSPRRTLRQSLPR